MSQLGSAPAAKRNCYVSYLKGLAILAIMLIHLIDWSGIKITTSQQYWKQFLYPSLLFFIALSGSLAYIVYGKYDSGRKIAGKLFKRGAQLIGVYFLYNIIKLYVFNFDAEPFYRQFSHWGKLNLTHILRLEAFTAPISIILTIGIFLFLSAPLIYAVKKTRRGWAITLALLAFNWALAYGGFLPQTRLTDFLLAKNNIMFPLLLWSIPYLIGFSLAQIGLEKRKYRLFILFSALFLIFHQTNGGPITDFMYPLRPPYIFFSFAFMYLLIIILHWIKKLPFNFVRYFLGTLNMLGEKTFAVYIIHWIVIDLTIWLLYPKYKYIWLSVAAYLLWQIYHKRRDIISHSRG